MSDGGAQRVTLNLIRYLALHYDHQIDLVLVKAKGAFMEQVPDNVRVVDLGASRTVSSLIGLIRYLRQNRPDVLLSGMDYVNVVALMAVKIAGTNTRTVVCIHNTMSAQQKNLQVFRGRFVVPLVKITHPWASVIVATSVGCGEDFLQVTGLDGHNMTYIYNPAVTDDISTLANESLSHPWFLSGAPPVILAVGRLAHQKNFPLLIEAFDDVRRQQDAKLLILGNGKDREELERLVTRLKLDDIVSLPGFVENPYCYMKNSAMFVLSSRHEALPAVLIEAMYCGTQLVASDCPSGPREILADGKYGTLVPPGDKKALTAAMLAALGNKDFKPDPNACDRFLDRNVVDRYLDVLLGDD